MNGSPELAELDQGSNTSQKSQLPRHSDHSESPSRLGEIIAGLPLKASSQFDPDADRRAEESEKRLRFSRWNSIVRKLGIRYEDCRLDNFEFYGSPDEQARQRLAIDGCRELCRRVSSGLSADDGLVLFGPPGTGKDHLLAAMLRSACASGRTCEWLNGLDFFGDMRDRMDSDMTESKIISDLAAPDILAISDPLPPWGPLTNFQAQTLFRVIDRRYRKELPIWVTINVADSTEAAERIGNAAVDRLKERALAVHCNWPSYRTAKKNLRGVISST